MRALSKRRVIKTNNIRGLGAYEPLAEQMRKLIYLNLKVTWDNVVQYVSDVENGLISRTTGEKVFDIGDFEVSIGTVYSQCILILYANPYWSFSLAYLQPLNQDSSTNSFYVRSKRATYTSFWNGGTHFDSVDTFLQKIAEALTHSGIDRPASSYLQVATKNTYQSATNQVDADKLLYQAIADGDAALKYQIEQDKKDFAVQNQISANINEAQNHYELAQEQLRIQQDEIDRLKRIADQADNNADLIYQVQQLERERLRQETLAQQAQQAIQVGTQEAGILAAKEEQQQKTSNAKYQLDKLKQIATNTTTGAKISTTTTTNATKNYKNLIAKPLTTTSTSRTEEEEEENVVDENGNVVSKTSLPWWAWTLMAVSGVAVVGGISYYIIKKGNKKSSKKTKNKK
jgi:hypothetical protein